MNWKVQDVLEHVQELVGEPAGSYYNLTSRIRQLNHAQREMVEDARALTSEFRMHTTIGQRRYYLPDNFLTYAKESPYYTDAAGNVYKLRVVDTGYMDTILPGWQKESTIGQGKPQYIILGGNQDFEVYPDPIDPIGEIVIHYVADPIELTDLTDEIFDGYTNLNRFAPALAYKVAATFMLPRSPQLGQQYQNIYNAEVRKMRALQRSNPQHAQTIRPLTYTKKRRLQ